MKRLAWALVLVTGLGIVTVVDFVRRTRTTFVHSANPLPGVVFTGQFNRVHAGLALLEQGALSPLLISGTNLSAGIPLEGFAQQFQLSSELQTALTRGNLVLGADAQNTFENAAEARRWFATLSTDSPIVLITSRFHMPRASLALEQALPGRAVLRVSVPEDSTSYREVAMEWGKFVLTHVAGAWAKNSASLSTFPRAVHIGTA